ncbi:hypothetical protein LA6_005487 (plasmid) [Paracoccaceae bacterium]|nr:hypothetical protein LA6_005487 [Paracoccaceae bacterium]
MTKRPYSAPGLLLLGSGPRLAGAIVAIALLWAAYFWATSMPGGL